MSGTVNICGNECPTNCIFKIISNYLKDEPNKYKICVKPTYIILKNFGDYKGWEDGTYSVSCEQYRYPPRFY